MAATSSLAVIGALGFAAPAQASYTNEPMSLGWNPAGPVHSSASQGGVVYVGGKLDGIGGIAALDAATGNLLWQLPANGDVRALTLSADGSKLYAGGGFSTVDGASHKHLVVISTVDHTIVSPWKGTASGMVRDLVVNGDTLFVGGAFAKLNGVANKGIGAVNATTGVRDATFNHVADGDVEGLALTPTSLLLVGTFLHIDGQPRSSLASINLADNSLTSWAPRRFCNGCDTYWDVQTDGTWAYVGASGFGGNFAAFNLATGQQRWPYVHADGDVQSVFLAGDGNAYLGGHFGTSIYNVANSRNQVAVTVVAAVNVSTGQPDPTFTPKIFKTYPGCWTFAATPGLLWAGGDFTGELQNTRNNHKPYLAAYPGI
ncbi:PQQ-binding-like beta-propeller repeat protein [Nocardioides cynanchi]|uniref:outer membrane protein assembly factor BamB family protein n=1 Tax=Nocardioides cynanchi TaxID=2558918 RepID=UPI00178326A8|nr:PQQ-binding-like beta-propeller repeat protein [Nocardioides cynanchi]